MSQLLGHLQIEETSLPPGQEWIVVAGAWRFARVQSGAAYWLDASLTRPLVAGELLVLGPKIQGSVRASQINEVVLHSFNFLPELLGGFFTLAERHHFDTADAGAYATARFLPATHPAARHFAEVVSGSGELQTLRNRVASLGLVVAILGGGLRRARPLKLRATSAQHRFQQLISLLPDTELIHHTPEDLAQLCGCSPRHFSRLFQRQFGLSVRAQQTELRLLHARQLLDDPVLPVAQVAATSGYRHLGLFNALFKRRFGMTPTDWRQRLEKRAAPLSNSTGQDRVVTQS